MCGIFCQRLLSKQGKLSKAQLDEAIKNANSIQHRGPDNTKNLLLPDNKTFFVFHRLAINGLSANSDEPIYGKHTDGKEVWLICNGEIYNYKKLITEHNLPVTTENDCEVIIHLFFKYGFKKTLHLLDGVFSIILYDMTTDDLWIANDPIGIRPLYIGYKTTMVDNSSATNNLSMMDNSIESKTDNSTETDRFLVLASEQIALKDCQEVEFFPPGSFMLHESNFELKSNYTLNDMMTKIEPYYEYKWSIDRDWTIPEIYSIYRKFLVDAVQKRLIGERPIACLLSGGLDSSLISSIASKLLQEQKGEQINTFSIGLKNSPDLAYARLVAKFINSNHHEVVVAQEDFLAAIPHVIRSIQSYDITTIRASCGNWLLAKHIAENTDFKIILNGDVSEEIHASYFYSSLAPSVDEFYQDNIRLLSEVHKYDVLRSARCIEHFGMEARTPFSDKSLINFVMSINPKWKMFGQDDCIFPMEKMLMRNAFYGWLPHEVLMRPKVAFSDGVSEKENSWHTIIQKHMEKQISDDQLKTFVSSQENIDSSIKSVRQIKTKEALYYYNIYVEHLGKHMLNLIPEFWMPRFTDCDDPSARELIPLSKTH